MNYDYYFLKSHDSIKECEKTTKFSLQYIHVCYAVYSIASRYKVL